MTNRRRIGDVVEDALHERLDLLPHAAPGPRRCGVRAGELVHIGALVVGELKDARERFKDRR
jgi:hypothetical protein